MVRLAVAAAALAAAGCATAYRNDAASSFTGGGFQGDGPGHLVRIGFSGNGYTSVETVRRYALFRAAEYAKAQGKPYFLLYPRLLDAARDAPGDLPSVGTVGGKSMAVAFVLLLDQEEPRALQTSAILAQLAEEQGKQGAAPAASGKDQP
jgi:hypothetical protein